MSSNETFLKFIDFQQIGGFPFIPGVTFSDTFGASKLNYASFRSGTANQRFISMWNSGDAAIYIAGLTGAFAVSPFTNITRNNPNVRLDARAKLEVSYSFSTSGPPLTANPPIALTAIQSGFNASSLQDAGIKAGFGTSVNMLSFVGAPTPPIITTETQDTDFNYSFVDTGLDWDFPGARGTFATTNNFETPVNALGFFFGTNAIPIPTNATINDITATFNGGTISGTGVAANAAMWFIDAGIDQSIPGPGGPLF